MATIVRMPEVVTGMEDATLASWLVHPGEEVVIGGPLAEIETDKAMVEYASEVEGTLAGHLVGQGDVVVVGDPIAVLADAGESVEAALAQIGGPTDESSSVPSAGEAVSDDEPVHRDSGVSGGVGPRTPSPARRQFASPLVRRIAKERGIDLTQVHGSGPNGRIVKRDIAVLVTEAATGDDTAAEVAAPESAPNRPIAKAQQGFVDLPLTPMRRAIAARLAQSKSTVPHFYLEADCRVDRLLDLRRTVNENSDVKISVNDFIVKAVASALRDIPEANAIWMGDSIRRFEAVDVAVAVAIDGGLVTPVARDVARRSLSEVGREIGDLARRARDGQVKQAELEGGSFCVSNLGMYGTERLTAIINPPQSAILAVGAATQRAVVTDGELAVATVMSVTFSGDHRVFDGALGAQWLAAFVKYIENPISIVV